ncbi:unnamed protein product [Candida parapsilosis]
MSVKTRKIAVVGSRAVGKSSMTVRYVEDHFVEKSRIRYKVLDTAGQDEYSMMNEKHLVGIHGYLLVYSVTSRQSFELVEFIRDKILNSIGNENIPMILIGNKRDLTYQRQVEESEGAELAQKFKCRFLETSVKENYHIKEAFEGLIDRIERIQNPPVVKKEDKCVII